MSKTLPLEDLESLIQQSLEPRRLRKQFRIPHPLSKFAANGRVKDGPCADAIVGFIQALIVEEPESAQHNAASWFLFKSEQAFFFACAEAGLDAMKLRSHLLKCQAGPPLFREEEDNTETHQEDIAKARKAQA